MSEEMPKEHKQDNLYDSLGLKPNTWLPFIENQHLIEIPEALGRRVADHVDDILEAGYGKLGDTDTFHGHLLVEKDIRYKMDELPEVTEVILFHTREYYGSWREGAEDNVPRSVVGMRDGKLGVAVPEAEDTCYRECGSVNSSSPFFVDGQRYHLDGVSGEVRIGRHKFYYSNQIYFRLEKDGRFPIQRSDKPLEVYIGIVSM